MTGHLDEIWEDLSDNAWLGGERDGWERGPYYVDGLLPLAHLLDDDRLLDKADEWVEGFLDAQDDDGWISPEQIEEGLDPNDPWPRFVVLKVLRQQYEATGDERALDAITAFLRYLHENPERWSIDEWAEMRWMEGALVAQWCYEETGEEWLRDAAALLRERGYDWSDHFRNFRYSNKQPLDVNHSDEQMATHGPNNAMGVKAPAVSYRLTGAETDRDAVHAALRNLDKYHGQATGVFSGDEHLSGKSPTQGAELCEVVEFMYSLEYLLETLGDAGFGDRLERVAYNALPATFTSDMWAHQYDQQVNQALATVGERPWTNHADANIFGQEPHFGCCQANFHQGWPKFTANLWMRAEDGLAAVAYGPSSVETEIDGTPVEVVEETGYPFEESVAFTVDVAEPTSFALHLRVPAWSEDLSLSIDGTEVDVDDGDYVTIDRTWAGGETVTMAFSPPVTVERRHHGGAAIRRGPLVFALDLGAERKQVDGEEPAADWELYPTERWNFALESPDDETAVDRSTPNIGPDETPFSPENPPLELDVRGRELPEWRLEGNSAGEIPRSPTASTRPVESLTLVPFGCTNLRIGEFPLLDPDAPSEE